VGYVAYGELGDTPNVIIDGSAAPSTVLTLSHWPGSGTPPELKADLSTEIVFRYLEHPELHVETNVVSNNHFDEDGVAGMWAFLNPEQALRRKDLLIDVASFGDFGTYRSREGARIAMALSAFADEDRSPLGDEVFDQRYPEVSASLYRDLLGRFHELLDHPDAYHRLWQEEDARLSAAEEAIGQGRIAIDETPALDLAVVTIPDELDPPAEAINNATGRFRILEMRGRNYALRYRYETWVQYVSSRPMQRVDLEPLAKELSSDETGSARWEFDGVDSITPSLHLTDGKQSAISPDVFRNRIEEFLSSAPPAWDPFA
jgi:uncharacterized protein DUF6687